MGEAMDFFKELRKRAFGLAGVESSAYAYERKMGIDATVRALKEMMVVPAPFKATLQHHTTVGGLECTTFHTFYQEVFDGHQGTDGEEVWGIVFRA